MFMNTGVLASLAILVIGAALWGSHLYMNELAPNGISRSSAIQICRATADLGHTIQPDSPCARLLGN